MKKHFIIIIALIVSVFGSYKSESQELSNINFGDDFSKWKSYFTLISYNPKDDSYNYEYAKLITTSYCHRKIERLNIGVVNNIVFRKIYFLIPNKNDVGVSQSLREELENIFSTVTHVDNLKMTEHDGTWGFRLDNLTLMLRRENNSITKYKDRITLYMKTNP